MPRKKRKRDYKREYRMGQGPGSKQIKNRAKRNKARRRAIREGRAKVGDGKHIDHKKPLSRGGSNTKRNTRVVSAKTNLKKQPKRGGKKKRKTTRRRKKR